MNNIYNDFESNILYKELPNNIHEYNNIDVIYRPADPKVMRKTLDEFAMVRKKTFVVTPEYNMNKKDTSKDFEETEYNSNYADNDELSWEVRYRTNFNINHFNRNIIDTNNNKESIRTDLKHDANDCNVNTVIGDKYEKMWKLLTKQNELIEKIASRYHEMMIKEANKPKHESFNKILRSLAIKRQLRDLMNNTGNVGNNTTVAEVISRSKENATEADSITANANNDTDEPSTIKTIFDETEIKNALKKDPFVQRILKMANKKKEDYFKKMRELNNE